MDTISTDDYMIYEDSDTGFVLAYLKFGSDPGVTVNVTTIFECNRENFVRGLHSQIARATESAFKRGSTDAKLRVRMALGLD